MILCYLISVQILLKYVSNAGQNASLLSSFCLQFHITFINCLELLLRGVDCRTFKSNWLYKHQTQKDWVNINL